jgi:hypothetical protein
MKRKSMLNILTSLVIWTSIICAMAIMAPAQGDDPNCGTKECLRDVAAARAGTAKYHEFQRALDDGFIQISPCIEVPGLGAMGFHFLNPARVDLVADPSEPEVLLYIPDDKGTMQLVAVEYSVPDMGQGRPTLFGLPMQGPEDRGGGPAYERHAWVWQQNRAGMFQPFNPRLSCPSS